MVDIHVALKDANSVASAIFESSTSPGVILRGQIDEITGRVLVDMSGGSSNTFVYNEIATGSGTSFTIAHTPVTGLYAVYANGQRLYPTTDFTLSGTTITTVLNWSAGAILVDYQY